MAFGLRAHDGVLFTKNDGQWEQNIRFKTKMNFGNIYFEPDGITYLFYEKSKLSREVHADPNAQIPSTIKAHSVKVKFVGSNPNPTFEAANSLPWYENYFLGNDQNKWATGVKSYKEILAKDIYNGIDVKYYQYGMYLKYDYIVHPGYDPAHIKIRYEGQDRIEIVDGNLIITNSLGSIKEMEPVAYQRIDGRVVEVECSYKLVGNEVVFEIDQNYDQSLDLIIDPVLIFSTYSGSTADNWGFTASYDNSENAFGAGIVFGAGYPTTTGAYDISYNGPSFGISTDIGVTKFSANGSTLLYSTYLGGTLTDVPHSIITDSLDNLYLLGTTSSSNYPITTGAYDATFNGGSPTTGFVGYSNGTDLVVTAFNSTGTALIGSTYLGGTSNDGYNQGTPLDYFYGDAWRGEIVIDNSGNCAIATMTNSSNFPVTPGAIQTTFGGQTDAVFAVLDPTLTTLVNSTFWGGSGFETGYGTQFDSNGNLYMVGSTTSSNMTTTTGVHKPTFGGGATDGYLIKLNPGYTSLLAATYIGTTSLDLSFFVQLDGNDDVYVTGISEGSYPVSTGYYTNSGSNQFIQKYNNTLTTSVWSTVVGTGNGTVDISPTAFLVNDCGMIYLTGWGGPLGGTTSTTTGLPITTNAHQSTTDGRDFYFMILTANAQALLYATFFGGTALTGEHVDGGTSRFDKNGTIYHAVCSGCGGNSLFPTTPGAWSTTNASSNCNMAVFKFGLGSIQTLISLPSPYVCIPSLYTFGNNTVGANFYIWDFGDGDSSNAFEPVHEYLDTGLYDVTLIAIDTNGCIEPDTASIQIQVYATNDAQVDTVPILCPGDSVQLNASGGLDYQWFPTTNMLNPNSPTPIVFPNVTTTYNAIITDSCISDTISIVVTVHPNNVSTSPDTSLCLGQSVQIQASGGVSYSWHPDPSISNASIADPVVNPVVSTTYYVDVTTVDGCIVTDSVFVFVYFDPPIPVISNDTTICEGDTILLTASNAPTINWLSSYNISTLLLGDNALVWPASSYTYVVEFTNSCATVYDSVIVTVDQVPVVIAPDTAICIGDTARLYASGGVTYIWSPASEVTDQDSNVTFAAPVLTSSYEVLVTDINGCEKSATMIVDVLPLPDVYAGADKKMEYGGMVQLNGQTNSGVSYFWTPSDSLSCISCLSPLADPEGMTQYVLHVTDANGCMNTDTVIVFVDGDLYLPNAFTPNGDNKNDFFGAKGSEIATFELIVFDRWGQIVYQSNDISAGWDGTVRGKKAKTDVYIWVVKYSYMISPQVVEKKMGHVTLLR